MVLLSLLDDCTPVVKGLRLCPRDLNGGLLLLRFYTPQAEQHLIPHCLDTTEYDYPWTLNGVGSQDCPDIQRVRSSPAETKELNHLSHIICLLMRILLMHRLTK